MTKEYMFPFELKEEIIDMENRPSISQFVKDLNNSIDNNRNDFVLSYDQFQYLIYTFQKIIENKKYPDKAFFVFLYNFREANIIQINDIKEHGNYWKTQKRSSQKMIQKLNSIKYSMFINLFLLKEMINIQQKQSYKQGSQQNQNRQQTRKLESITKNKYQLFKNIYKITKEIDKLHEFFNPDEQMLKHLQTLGILVMKDLENIYIVRKDLYEKIEKELYDTFIYVLKMFKTNDKFHRQFRNFLDNQENPIRENNFAGKLLSNLLGQNDSNINEVVKKTTEELIRESIQTKSSDNFDKNCRQTLLTFFELQPQYYFDNIKTFKALLTSDKQVIRSCFIESLLFLLRYLQRKILNEGQESLKTSYQEIFTLLLSRSMDKTYNCRLNTLKTIQEVLKQLDVEFSYLYEILKVLGERIKDSHHHVRNRSLKILQQIVVDKKVFLTSEKQKQIKEELEQMQLEEQQNTQIQQDNNNEDDQQMDLNNPQKMYLLHQKNIFQKIIDTLPWIKQLIFSKYKTDVHQALGLIVIGNFCKIKDFQELFLISLKLIWDKEQDTKIKITDSFYQIVFQNQTNQQIAITLLEIVQGLDMQQKLSFEQVIGELLKEQQTYKITSELSRVLWNNFIKDFNKQNEFEENCQLNLYLLRLTQNYFDDWIVSNLENIFSIFKMYYKEGKVDWDIIQEFVYMFINSHEKLSEDKKDTILKLLVFFLLKYQGCNDSKYFQVAEKIIKLIFILRNDPEKVCDFVLKRMANFLNKDINHISSDQVFQNVDNVTGFSMTQQINRRQTKENFSLGREDIKFNQKLMHIIFIAGEISLKFLDFFTKVDTQLQKRKNTQLNNEIKDELQQALGGADQEYSNQKQVLEDIIERLLDEDSMLYSFYIFVQKIIINEVQKSNPQEDIFFNVCINSLIKFMILNKKISRENLQLLYQILDHETIPENFKSNVIIGIGDLFNRYPGIITTEIKKLFGSLYSKSEQLKMTTITVLSHLILNDFMKIKNDISNFAILLLDENPQIVENVKTFFNELQRKESDFVTNIIIDVLDNLSKDENDGGISIDKFEQFAEYILSFLDKDTKICQLIQKLLDELRITDDTKKIINILCCIRILAHKEPHLDILNSNVVILRQKLNLKEVKIIIDQILKKFKKNTKIEKSQLEGLENNLFSKSDDIYKKLEQERPKKKFNTKGKHKKNKQIINFYIFLFH